MEVTIPEFCLVILVGPSGSGKSTFARKHFKPTEILSSDACRAMVSDDENNQMATRDAFEVLHLVAEKRLAAGRLTVIDATNVQPQARQPLLALARKYYCQPVALVFDLPEDICVQRNQARPERRLGPDVIHRQIEQLHRSLPGLEKVEVRSTTVFHTPQQVDEARIRRRKMESNRRSDPGPFDVIGDLHGCCTELEELLDRLGYRFDEEPTSETNLYPRRYYHPEGRKAVFLGDLLDRGPRILDTYGLVRSMVQSGGGLCVQGNHDEKLLRKLRGRNVQVSHGLEMTLRELDELPEDLRQPYLQALEAFLAGLPSHYVLDHGGLVVAHAGIRKGMIGREAGPVHEFTLYGETTGEIDAYGLPVRTNWAARYHGRALIVYGHTAVKRPYWLNHTINIDTGCVYGGKLTALRYPEKSLVAVQAARVYSVPKKPLQGEAERLRQEDAPEWQADTIPEDADI